MSNGDGKGAEGSNRTNAKGESDLLAKLMGDDETEMEKPSIEEMVD